MIVDLILEGMSGVQIADKYGFTDATVIYRVKRFTGKKPSELRAEHGWAGMRIPPEEVDKIVDMYLAKDAGDPEHPYVRPTLASVARQTGHAPETIRQILKSQGVRIGGHRSYFSDQQKQEIVDLYSHGWSCPRLAEKLGVNEITVRRTLNAAGVSRRPRGRPPIKRETPSTS